ncbi:MAG: hypothetical protein ACFB10_12275 [Salibacteraceae bacterium]
MIQHLSRAAIDAALWDQCIAQSTNRLLYAFSWYLDELGPWSALVKGDYEAVMPLPFRQKMGFKYLFIPFSAQQLGVFASNTLTPEEVTTFIEAIPKTYRFVDIRFNQSNPQGTISGEWIQHRNQELDLNPSYEELRGKYGQNLKRNLKKAVKENWKVNVDAFGSETVVEMFRAYKGDLLPQLEEDFYSTLLRLAKVCASRKQAEVWTISGSDGNLTGGVLLFKDHQRIYSMLTAVNEPGRRGCAIHWLRDQMVQQYAGKPVVLDFEGSNEPGLARFNLQFGGKDCLYLQLRKNHLPRGIKWLKK